MSFAIRRLRANDWPRYRAFRLRALGDAPDAFGSTLEVEQAKPTAYWTERLANAAASQWQLPLVAEEGSELVGLVWGWIDPSKPEVAQIFQMWVAPEARGQRCGAALLDSVIAWAKGMSVTSVQLRVTCGDTPARRLYERAGFKPFGDAEQLRPGAIVLAQPMTLEV